MNQNTMNAICILDGDNNGQKDTKHNIIVLPGKNNPEQLIFDYYDKLANATNFEMYQTQSFWHTDTALNNGLTKQRYTTLIKPQITAIEDKIRNLKEEGKSTSGVKRDENKKVFNGNLEEFKIVLDFWLDNHYEEMYKFYKDLRHCFRQVSLLHRLDPELWPRNTGLGKNRLSNDY
ncbi:hypothetical protein [Neisseria iguanae]|uniref:hypothetical protein n=1 Tax=Neisseria iguanae TaxID=90242 RepID=UPI001FE9CDAD|nr:hypothetical protein [Neisseria iguanae]